MSSYTHRYSQKGGELDLDLLEDFVGRMVRVTVNTQDDRDKVVYFGKMLGYSIYATRRGEIVLDHCGAHFDHGQQVTIEMKGKPIR